MTPICQILSGPKTRQFLHHSQTHVLCTLGVYSLLSESDEEFDTLVATTAVHVVAVVHQRWGKTRHFNKTAREAQVTVMLLF